MRSAKPTKPVTTSTRASAVMTGRPARKSLPRPPVAEAPEGVRAVFSAVAAALLRLPPKSFIAPTMLAKNGGGRAIAFVCSGQSVSAR
jgi:hypothetical protein